MIDFNIGLMILLFCGGLFAGIVDAIAGGGGLISLPLLLSSGLPVPIALGTNKLQSTIGTLVATHNYFKNKLISFELIIEGLLSGLVGSTLGSLSAQYISASLLEKLLPLLMSIIFLYTIFTPRLGLIDGKKRMSEFYFYLIFGFILGFYDGFLGPGAGSFWIAALIFFLGYNLIKATAYTKIFNLNSNVVALIWFMLGHHIDYQIGLIMACGQFFGGKIGSQLVISKGAKLVRPIFISVVFCTILSLFYKYYFR